MSLFSSTSLSRRLEYIELSGVFISYVGGDFVDITNGVITADLSSKQDLLTSTSDNVCGSLVIGDVTASPSTGDLVVSNSIKIGSIDILAELNAEKAKTAILESQMADVLARLNALENP